MLSIGYVHAWFIVVVQTYQAVYFDSVITSLQHRNAANEGQPFEHLSVLDSREALPYIVQAAIVQQVNTVHM